MPIGVRHIQGQPDKIPNLLTWFKADAIVGKNDGDTITTWIDSSINSFSATTTGNGASFTTPIYKTNILNGKPCVRFVTGNGLSTALLGATILANPTVFAVTKPTSTTNTYAPIITVDGGSIGNTFFSVQFNSNLALYGIVYYTTNVTNFQIFLTPIIAPVTNQVSCLVAQNNGTTVTHKYYDSTDIKLKELYTTSQGNNNISGSNKAISIGTRQLNNNDVAFVGDMYELIVFDRALTVKEIQLVEHYLKYKWGL
jgi:hypothetical protein